MAACLQHWGGAAAIRPLCATALVAMPLLLAQMHQLVLLLLLLTVPQPCRKMRQQLQQHLWSRQQRPETALSTELVLMHCVGREEVV